MERFVDIDAISDGKKYTVNDMAKIGCNDCKGCSDCCKNMGKLITLDPYDVYRMTTGLGVSFEQLLSDRVELMVDEGVIIPSLLMNNQNNYCSFLDDNGRCSIHELRPGICRLFPMGRLYEGGGFYYFLQKDECSANNKTKVKLKQWLDTPNIAVYEKYICDWHFFIKNIQGKIKGIDEETAKMIDIYLLNNFYIQAFGETFYEEFYQRLEQCKQQIKRMTDD